MSTTKNLLSKSFSFCKRSANVRYKVWYLSLHEYYDIVKEPCAYCGSIPDREKVYKEKSVFVHGIDRIHNGFGYMKSNCISCCIRCNKAKSNRECEEFIQWVKRAALHLNSSDVDFRLVDEKKLFELLRSEGTATEHWELLANREEVS